MRTRADRARSVAATAAYGGGGLAAAGLLGVGVLRAEVEIARRLIGDGPGTSYDDTGHYGAGVGQERQLVMLGDSSAAGVGAGGAAYTVGATVATGVAAMTGRPVRLTNVSRSGATSPQLYAQVELGLQRCPEPEVAIIMIGTNDVKERIEQARAVRSLSDAVHTLREAGAHVVVGTCPDLGTIRPIPQPLRWLVERWSRDLAAAQTVAVVEAGGRTVSTGDLIGPDFRSHPEALFSEDRFHPSAAGYARAAAAIMPSVLDALGVVTIDADRRPERARGESVEPLTVAAERAVDDPGSEVSGTHIDGRPHGARGRWARLLRRHPTELPEEGADSAPDPEPQPPG